MKEHEGIKFNTSYIHQSKEKLEGQLFRDLLKSSLKMTLMVALQNSLLLPHACQGPYIDRASPSRAYSHNIFF